MDKEGLGPMGVTRRSFLKFSGLTAGSILLPAGSAPAEKIKAFPLHKPVKEAATICPYCSCGCGLLIATGPDGHIINAEGDPDNPINRGALDPKSIAVKQLSASPLRLQKPLYRAAGSDKFEEKEWGWMVAEVAKRIKASRDATFQRKNEKGITVNRTSGIAFMGGAANNNEECYLGTKLSRALGIVYLEHQARV
jgi:formate dehydrogenase major subunit